MLSVKYQTLLPHIVSVVGQNAKLCPPLKAPLGEDDQDEGGEKKEKHLLVLTQVDWVLCRQTRWYQVELGGITLQVNQMGPRGRLTLDGPSLKIRLRKTDTAMPKHAGGPHVAYN